MNTEKANIEDRYVETKIAYNSHLLKLYGLGVAYVVGLCFLITAIAIPLQEGPDGPAVASGIFGFCIGVCAVVCNVAYLDVMRKKDNPKVAYVKAKRALRRAQG